MTADNKSKKELKEELLEDKSSLNLLANEFEEQPNLDLEPIKKVEELEFEEDVKTEVENELVVEEKDDIKSEVALKTNTDLAEITGEDVDSDLPNSDVPVGYDFENTMLDDELSVDEIDEQAKLVKRKEMIFRGLVAFFIFLILAFGIAYIIKLASDKEYIEGVNVYVDGIKQTSFQRVEKEELTKKMVDYGYTEENYITDESKGNTDKEIYLLKKKKIFLTFEHNGFEMKEVEITKYLLVDVLKELNIEPDQSIMVYLNNSLIQPDQFASEKVTTSSHIKVVKNETAEEEVEEKIPFKTIIKQDSELEEGKTKVDVIGVNGIKKVTYGLKLVDGTVIEREVIKTEIVKEPVAEVILEGTKKKDLTKLDSDNDGLNDQEELDLGTDPYKFDTDGDGISDRVEIENGTNPLDANDPPKTE